MKANNSDTRVGQCSRCNARVSATIAKFHAGDRSTCPYCGGSTGNSSK